MEGPNKETTPEVTTNINFENTLQEIDEEPRKELFEIYKIYEEDKYNTSGIESQFRPFLRELKSEIDTHAFTCIVGDDKTARVPALTIGETINKIYALKGEESAPVLFIDPHNYTGAMGGDRGQGEESESRHSVLKEKVKKLFHDAGVKEGDILLVTDYISTGSTVKSFEDIANEVGCKIHIINKSSWHGRTDHGLSRNEIGDSLHARSQFLDIKTPTDVVEQLDRLDRDCFDYEHFYELRLILLEMKIKLDPSFPIESVKKIFSGRQINKLQFRSFVLDDLTFEQQKSFFELFRKVVIVEPRKRALLASTKLAEWYLLQNDVNKV